MANIIGEFGTMNKNNESERAEWAVYYVSAAKTIGVPCIWWDNGLFEGNGERFGLFDRQTYECKYPELLAALMKGLGMR
ncbi:MAG: glycoside hydrolase family 5 protein [Lachnospiraceae bacterium]|nr:glycoside hydrolase family 5 protein [Lachnospiraceae bacterium]MDE7202108.1 glycoside hydrolase family 5 protein [Lachnospiraceae bacterium]